MLKPSVPYQSQSHTGNICWAGGEILSKLKIQGAKIQCALTVFGSVMGLKVSAKLDSCGVMTHIPVK